LTIEARGIALYRQADAGRSPKRLGFIAMLQIRKDFGTHLFFGTDPEMMSACHSPSSSGAHRCQIFAIVSISVISAALDGSFRLHFSALA
jgi:hypothetical protein